MVIRVSEKHIPYKTVETKKSSLLTLGFLVFVMIIAPCYHAVKYLWKNSTGVKVMYENVTIGYTGLVIGLFNEFIKDPQNNTVQGKSDTDVLKLVDTDNFLAYHVSLADYGREVLYVSDAAAKEYIDTKIKDICDREKLNLVGFLNRYKATYEDLIKLSKEMITLEVLSFISVQKKHELNEIVGRSNLDSTGGVFDFYTIKSDESSNSSRKVLKREQAFYDEFILEANKSLCEESKYKYEKPTKNQLKYIQKKRLERIKASLESILRLPEVNYGICVNVIDEIDVLPSSSLGVEELDIDLEQYVFLNDEDLKEGVKIPSASEILNCLTETVHKTFENQSAVNNKNRINLTIRALQNLESLQYKIKVSDKIKPVIMEAKLRQLTPQEREVFPIKTSSLYKLSKPEFKVVNSKSSPELFKSTPVEYKKNQLQRVAVLYKLHSRYVNFDELKNSKKNTKTSKTKYEIFHELHSEYNFLTYDYKKVIDTVNSINSRSFDKNYTSPCNDLTDYFPQLEKQRDVVIDFKDLENKDPFFLGPEEAQIYKNGILFNRCKKIFSKTEEKSLDLKGPSFSLKDMGKKSIHHRNITNSLVPILYIHKNRINIPRMYAIISSYMNLRRLNFEKKSNFIKVL